jgi:hypothetical protein
MISKLSQALFMTTIVGLGMLGASPSAQAGNLAARFGKSDYPTSEPNCWQPYAATVTNVCTTAKFWSLPLISVGAGSFWTTISAQGAASSNNVGCRTVGVNSSGTLVHTGGYVYLSQFGAAQNLSLATYVPAGGAGVVDCWVNPGGKLHVLSW